MIKLKYPLRVSDFNQIWIFSTDLRTTMKSNLMKSCAMEVELFHGAERERQTDMTKLIVTFRNFANAPET